MYPQYLQRLLRTHAHADTAYLTGVVVRVRNKTPSFRTSFDALFTLAALDNGTMVYTHTPVRPETFRADVAALLRGAAARGHVSKHVVLCALSGKPAPQHRSSHCAAKRAVVSGRTHRSHSAKDDALPPADAPGGDDAMHERGAAQLHAAMWICARAVCECVLLCGAGPDVYGHRTRRRQDA